MDRIYKLQGVIQNYTWGGTNYIPELLGVENPDQKPFGEYWLGAHPAAPAIVAEADQKLDAFIAENRIETLGEAAATKFGSLPYLFKILDVRQMLSIQVHPSKEAAEKAFEEENEK
ncbi:MAG TPA: type I phosphomannose isomerase catalytic subunit, partial [Flavisolibacter sp.]